MAHRVRGMVKSLRIKDFTEWLHTHGFAEFMEHDFEVDLLVYHYDGEVCRVQELLDGSVRWIGSSHAHYHLFELGRECPALKTKTVSKSQRKRQRKRGSLLNRIIERDGRECFYCGKHVDHGEETIEHLLPQSAAKHHPGTLYVVNDIRNLVLAHHLCNHKAGELSVVEKVKLRERLHDEHADPAHAQARDLVQHQGRGL